MDNPLTLPVETAAEDAEFAEAQARIQVMIREYETDYEMSSETFMRLWMAGKLTETFEFNDWSALLQHVSHSEG